ncbi:VWA domain-containing protein [Edaphobacter flagellatus]|uniref:VWA domain-containing protein n=1 Tax=Edaphobacter flagellatus TaxID=1933044 RepID=UPI0021B2583B|nr:VWA domain-containing protein [Edaphobacter flagellatus]
MRWLLTVVLLSVISGTLCAQNTSNTGSTLHTGTRLVVVPVLVQSATKEVVYSLHADDFLLTDKGVPQKVSLDEANKQPLSLVVLMQTGSAAVREFDKYRGLETMLASILGGTPNQVAIVNFDSKPEAASPFTSDIAQWTDAIDHPDPGDSGAAIMDALKFGLDLLAKQPANHRRVILLISQPQDSGSKTTAKEIARITGETNTAIYSITFTPQITRLKGAIKEGGHPHPPVTVGNGSYVAYFELTEPLQLMKDAIRKDVAAEAATLSGGEAIRFENRQQLADVVASIGNHIRYRYMLTFTPSPADLGFHPIRVSLIHYPELTVSARSSYWLTDSENSK